MGKRKQKTVNYLNQTIYILNYIVIFTLGMLRLYDIQLTSEVISRGLAWEKNILARRFFEDGNIIELILLNMFLLIGFLLLNYYGYSKDYTELLIIIFIMSIGISIYTYAIIYQNLQLNLL